MEILLLIFVAYLVPTAVAIVRKHHNESAIITLNILLGWTFIGWVAALVWSLTSPPKVAREKIAEPANENPSGNQGSVNQLKTSMRHIENILEACREVSKPAFDILIGAARADGKISRDDIRIIANLFIKHGADIKPAWIESLAALNAGVSMSVTGEQIYDEEISALESASPALKAGIYGAYTAMTLGNKRQTETARRIGEQLESLLTTTIPTIESKPASATSTVQQERKPLPIPNPSESIAGMASTPRDKKSSSWVEQAQKEIEDERRRKTPQKI